MSVIPDHIENASFEAHMAAAEKIAAALGIERAKPGDVALALAYAYGEAVGLYAMTGAASNQLEALAVSPCAPRKAWCRVSRPAIARGEHERAPGDSGPRGLWLDRP